MINLSKLSLFIIIIITIIILINREKRKKETKRKDSKEWKKKKNSWGISIWLNFFSLFHNTNELLLEYIDSSYSYDPWMTRRSFCYLFWCSLGLERVSDTYFENKKLQTIIENRLGKITNNLIAANSDYHSQNLKNSHLFDFFFSKFLCFTNNLDDRLIGEC